MNTLTLADRRSRATAAILPEVGFNLFRLQIPAADQVIDVLDHEPGFEHSGASPTHNGIPLLFPYPNRIRGGRYVWDGRERLLTNVHQDPGGNAIHGLVFDRPWRVVERGDDFAVGRFQLSVDAPERCGLWPADFVIDVQYALRESILRCDVRIANPDQVPLPWGFGTHPYFRVPLAAGSAAAQCLVQVRANSEWELVDCLPTGKKRGVSGRADLRDGQQLGGLKLDNVYTDLALVDGHSTSVLMDPAAGLEIVQTADAVFRDLVAYTPGHGRSVCLEPYTCITDAVNLESRGIDAGWRVVPPGGEFRTWFQIAARPIYV